MAESIIYAQLERVAKALPVVLAVLYVAGFIIVAFRLAEYSASSLDLFRIQYVAAGFWFGFLYFIFMAFAISFSSVPGQYLFQQIQYPSKPKFLERIEVRQLAGAVVGDIFAVILLITVVFFATKAAGRSTSFWTGCRFFLSLAVIDLTMRAWLLFKSRQNEGLSWSYSVHVGMLFLVVAILNSLTIFAQGVYPILPFPIGGGRTRQVIFCLGSQSPSVSTPTFLERDGATAYTIPYELLLENENSYVVISPNIISDQLSLTVRRLKGWSF